MPEPTITVSQRTSSRSFGAAATSWLIHKERVRSKLTFMVSRPL